MSVIQLPCDASVASVAAADVPCLLYFTATWCGPCRAVYPEVEAIARDYEGRLCVVKVDIDEHTELADQAAVASVPTFQLVRAPSGGYRGGAGVLAACTGADAVALRAMLARHVP